MAVVIPSQPWIELPLLLELERAGGSVTKGTAAFDTLLEGLARHFPALTGDDQRLLRADGKTQVWDNCIAWTRNSLRQKGQLDGGTRGTWEITAAGKTRLRDELKGLGLADYEVEGFIRSSQYLPERVGARWQPQALTLRPGRFRRAKGTQPKPFASLTISQAAPSPSPTAPPVPLPSPLPGDDTRSLLLQRVLSLSPAAFEKLVGRWLEAKGLSNIRVTGRSHDGGIDGTAEYAFLAVKVAFQAKRWTNAVGAGPVGEFKGRIGGKDRGIFVTTSSFTPGARETAELPGVPVFLIDGQDFVGELMEFELGIKRIPVTREDVDEDFFASI